MLREITAEQLIRWEAYSSLEPWDERRQDLRIASIVWHMHDLMRTYLGAWGAKNPPEPKKLEEYALQFGDAQQGGTKKTWQQMKAIAYQWATIFNRKAS